MKTCFLAAKTTAAFALMVLLAASCKKDNKHTDDPGDNGGDQSGCTVSKADAESFAAFPADNPWRADVSQAAIDPYSSQIITALGSYAIKADFGSGLWEGAPIGIPYVVVCGSQTKYPVTFRANSYDDNYGNESDAGPYAIPLNAPIEGNGTGGDSHVIAVDKDNKVLYELYNASKKSDHWEASSGAIFDLTTNALRKEGNTSADAAGLPIFAGLVRYEEIVKGEIDHPIRFTLEKPNVKPAYIAPARHKVNSTGGQYSLPFGARIRLKNSFDISSYSATNQVILKAMKKYGLILADIGSNLYITGAPDDRWNNDDLQKLGKIKGSDFEVVKFN
ncbi:hypothetical protein A4H97_22150 [Niastella yeongjuensis]|uniref:Uncharacterized protein n=1 Tax=Niastella yeongjuensis TaxID=354355 RepID=A0A1V9F8U8_9BACT|nr:hypothetical protein [Niastella yeongjuensis]OQP54667.1 hypothetical protein A4H97_22150 [Niastella yeongjuensis]SEO03111.1 hypothetical protein SAMN05660816_01946 [Niastella yeongjuensis]